MGISTQNETPPRVRILLVEDDPGFANLLRSVLLEEGKGLPWVVDVARTAEQAERSIEEDPPALVLMDIRLPGVSGIECTRRVKELSPTTTVVMLTASDEEADLMAALEAGASGYLLKTMDIDDLVSTVLAVAQGHLVIPSRMASPILAVLAGSPLPGGGLSKVEEEILRLMGGGASQEQVARKLSLTQREILSRISAIYSKLHLQTRATKAEKDSRNPR